MGALIATSAFGENDPAIVRAVLESLPFVTSRYAHSEYQTTLSLRLKAELNRIAPVGTPRHFVVNTGAEAVENAIKSVLLNRVKTSEESDGGFIVSFEGAFHGRTLETLETTASALRAIGVALRDRVSSRIVGYAIGSALEDHDEEGVHADPHFGEHNTFYLQAMATSPTVQNDIELENCLLESLRTRAIAAGFEFLSTLIEERLRDTSPSWFRDAAVLGRIENYLHSGTAFVYLQLALTPSS